MSFETAGGIGYKVERTNQSPSDITEYVEMITKCTDVGHGEIPSAQIMFESREGEIATDVTALKQFDPIKITIEDDTTKKYERHFIVDRISPQRNETGRHVIVDLMGRQRYMQKMYAPSWWYYRQFKDVLNGLVDIYNQNKTDAQPTASWVNLDSVPSYTYGTFDFGMETTVHDAIQQVVQHLGLPVAAGGGGERFAVVEDETSNADNMILRILPRGKRTNEKPEIKNPMSFTREKDPERGNVVVAIGQAGAGSYPGNVSRYRSLQESYENFRLYETGVSYPPNAYVRYKGAVYQRKNDASSTTVPPTNTSRWSPVSFDNYKGNLDYSPWTKGKADAWRRMAANGTSSNIGDFAYPDANMVVREITFDDNDASNSITAWRDWVDFKTTSLPASNASIPNHGSVYEGMRILYTGSARKDKFEKEMRNSMLQYADGEWIVFREATQFDECCIMDEAKIYQFNRNQTGRELYRTRHTSKTGMAWRDISGKYHGNDVFHYPSGIENVAGLISDESGEASDPSAIEIKYTHNLDFDIASIIAPLFFPFLLLLEHLYGSKSSVLTDAQKAKLAEKDLYNNGWWATLFEAPFPKTGANRGTLYKQSLLDLHNVTLTPSGKRGYSQEDASNLGPMDGISFLFKFNVEGVSLRDLTGGVPFRCYINDIFGETWVSDFSYRFQNETQHVTIPFNSFSNYRARLPVSFDINNWTHRVINPELRQTGIWERFFIKRIGVYCLWPYDDQGRYDPWKWENVIHNILPDLTGGTLVYTGTIDAFHFTKAPVAIAKDDTAGRHTMRAIAKHPSVSNVIQLENLASAELDVDMHQEDAVEFRVDNLNDDVSPCELKSEQKIRIKDKYVINAAEEDSEDTREYIVEKITYSVGDRSHNSALVANILARRQVATG